MKRIIFLLCFGIGLPTFALPISEQGRQESRFFMDFLETVYLQREQEHESSAKQDLRVLQALQELLKQEPESAYLKRQLVSEAVARGETAWADPYADFIEQSEKTSEDYRVYGAYLASKEDWSGAIEAYEKALEGDEDARELYQERDLFGEYVALLGSLPLGQAVQNLEELAEKYPFVAAGIYTEIGRLYVQHKQLQQALNYFNKALEQSPTFAAARVGRALVYEQAKQYFLMLHELEKLDKEGYVDAGVYERMGSMYFMVKDYAKAETYFLKVWQLEGGDPSAAYFLSVLYENQGHYDKALYYITHARDYQESPDKQLQASFYLQQLGQLKESIDILARVYELSDKSAQAGYLYALALREDNQLKKAAKIFRQVVEQVPDNEQVRLEYAFVLESLKKYADMETQVRAILAQNPNNAVALNLLAYSLTERGERLEEAQDLVARALALYPNEYAFMDTQAWLYCKQGKWAEADSILSTIPANIVADNAEIAYHLGVVRAAQGRVPEALSYLEQAKTTWPAARKMYNKIK